MSSVPITKKESGTDDLLKLFAEQIKKQKISQVDTKSLIHLFRPLPESLALADLTRSSEFGAQFPLAFPFNLGLDKPNLPESLSLADSLSSAIYTRFELEAVDGFHANETPCKIEFWELMVS